MQRAVLPNAARYVAQRHVCCLLTMPAYFCKIKKKNFLFVFRPDIRTFDFVEGTFARKSHNKFGFLLTYSYLCPKLTILWT